jgi:hypothetical protein
VEVAIKTSLPTFCWLRKMSALTGLQKRQDLCVLEGGGDLYYCFVLSLQSVLGFLMGVMRCSFGHCTVSNIHSKALIDLFMVVVRKYAS